MNNQSKFNDNRSFDKDLPLLIRGSFWIALGGVIANAGGAIFWILASKLVSPTDIGYAVSAFSIAGMLAALANLGFNYAVLREIPERGSSAFTSALALAVISGVVVAFLSGLFSDIYIGFSRYIFPIYILTVLSLVNMVGGFSLVAIIKTKYVTIINALSTITRLVIGLGLVILGFGGFGIVVGLVSAYIVSAVLFLAIAIYFIGFKPPSISDLKRILSIGVSNYPNIFSNQLVMSLGVVILAVLTRDPGSVSVLYLALMITMVLAIIPETLSNLSIPIMVRSNSTRLSQDSVRVGLAVGLPISIIIATLSPDILGLLNQSYRAMWIVLSILSISIVTSVILNNIVSKLNTLKDIGKLWILGLARLLTLALLIAFLVPIIGIIGAAISYIASTLAPYIYIKTIEGTVDKALLSTIACLSMVSISITTILYNLADSSTLTILLTSISILFITSKILSINEIIDLLKTLALPQKARKIK